MTTEADEAGDGNISLDTPVTQELSYQISAASWANWLLNRFKDPNGLDEEEKESRRLDTVVALVTGLGQAGRADGTEHKA